MIAALAIALDPTGADLISDALRNLRMSPGISISIDGLETIGNRSGKTRIDIAYFEQTQNSRLWAWGEMAESANGYLVKRTVGDGLTFWSWSPARNEYLSAVYGSYGKENPKDYKNNLFQSLATVAMGPAAYGVRLVREVYGGDSAGFREWLPGATTEVLTRGMAPFKDAITGQPYAADDTHDYIVQELGDPVRRCMTFERTKDDQGTWRLTTVFVADITRVGRETKVSNYTIRIQPGDQPAAWATFRFVPPSGAKALPLEKGGRG